MRKDPSNAPRPLDFATIAIVSATVMIYQVALTRVLSVVVWYHFAFLTISLVMLGLGAPGIWFAERKDPVRWLPAFLVASGVAVPASIAMVVTFGPRSVAGDASLLVISCLVLVPLGAVLGLFFPLGMQRFGDNAKPWYWAMNGVFGVVASVMSLALSMEFGFRAVGLFAAAGYVVAWACLRDEP
jgi:hypothetical protein